MLVWFSLWLLFKALTRWVQYKIMSWVDKCFYPNVAVYKVKIIPLHLILKPWYSLCLV